MTLCMHNNICQTFAHTYEIFRFVSLYLSMVCRVPSHFVCLTLTREKCVPYCFTETLWKSYKLRSWRERNEARRRQRKKGAKTKSSVWTHTEIYSKSSAYALRKAVIIDHSCILLNRPAYINRCSHIVPLLHKLLHTHLLDAHFTLSKIVAIRRRRQHANEEKNGTHTITLICDDKNINI